MRSGHVAAAVVMGLFVASVCSATSVPLGPPVALGPGSLEVEMERNPELASLIARRGYPDWAERVEVAKDLLGRGCPPHAGAEAFLDARRAHLHDGKLRRHEKSVEEDEKNRQNQVRFDSH